MEGRETVFYLEPGDTTVGSLPGNAVCLPGGRVSRHHAVIRCSPGTVAVEDLSSTNGTFVNGVRVTRGSLAPGDWVQFGSVVLTLESVPAAEAQVAVPIGPLLDARAADRPAVDQTTEIPSPVPSGGRWLDLVTRVCRHLFDRTAPNLEGALAELASGCGAEVAGLLSWDRHDVAVMALSGSAAALGAWQPTDLNRSADGGSDPGWVVVSNQRLEGVERLAAIRSRGGQDGDALVVAGPSVSRDAPSVLEPVLHLLTAAGSRRADITSPPPRAPRGELVFPATHVVGTSLAMRRLYDQLRGLLQGAAPVLISGETGSGKEHVLRILHASSERASGPLQVLNCAAIPEALLEAELFGIEAGVATGVGAREGKFRLAHGGVLFFDEVADMAPGLQAKLLRALQEGEVHPVGSRRPVRVDVRIVAATNSDLGQRMTEGTFRRDLFFRIAGCEVRVPPLRERPEDIPALARAFLERFATEAGRRVRGLSLLALEALQGAPWPGNVRQLEHEVRRLVSVCPEGGVIESAMLSPRTIGVDGDEEVPSAALDLRQQVAALERRLILQAVARSGGNLAEAARLLGLTRNGLVMKMQRLGIRREERAPHCPDEA